MAKGKPTPRITDTGLKAPRPKLKDVTPKGTKELIKGTLTEEAKRAKSRQSAQKKKNNGY